LLLLAFLKFMMVSCCWSPGVTNGVVGVSAVPFEHAVAGGPAVTGFPAVDAFLLLLVSLLIMVFLFQLVALPGL
jgi:hypothetical protein